MTATAAVFAGALVACRGLIGYEDGLELESGDGPPADGDAPDRGEPEPGPADGSDVADIAPEDGASGDGWDAGLDAQDAQDAPLRRVFVTTTPYGANEVSDMKCTAEATAASLGGDWVAWRSYGTTNAIDAVGEGPWYLTKLAAQLQDELFINRANIDAGLPPSAALSAPNGAPVAAGQPIWTGTSSSGKGTGADCSSWTSLSSMVRATVGRTGNTMQWTDDGMSVGGLDCTQPARIICFQK